MAFWNTLLSCCRKPAANPAVWIVLIYLAAMPTAFAEEGLRLKPIHLQLKWYHQFQFAGYYAAEKQGYYRSAGLAVNITQGAPGRPALKTVLEGGADFGVTDAEVVLARLQGKPVVACAAIFQHSPYIMLSLAESGITKPSDLVGKRLMASTFQGGAELKAMIMREGLSLDGVNFINHTWNSRDLVDGKVDAISAYLPVEPTQIRQMGAKPSYIRFSDYGVDFYGDTLFTTEQFVSRDRQATETFVRASLKGWEYAMANSQEMVEYILNIPGVQNRGIKRENLENEAKAMVPLIQTNLVEVGHMNAGRWERIARTFVETGIAPKVANLDGFLLQPDRSADLRPLFWGLAIVSVIGALGGLWTLQLRRQVEMRTREVKAGQKKFAAILNNTFQLQGLLDAEGRVIVANSRALDFCGLTMKDVEGMWIWEAAWWGHSTAEQARLKNAVRRVQEGDEVARFETSHMHHNGSLRDIDFSIRRITSDEGRLLFLMVEGYDVTDRKRAEEDRRISEANLLALLENSSGAIWSLDGNLRYLTFNARYQDHILALGGQQARIGGAASETEPAAHYSRWEPHYQRAIKGERFRVTFESEIGGRLRFFTASFNPIRHGTEVTGVSIFCDEVTEQRQLEEQLRQSQKMDAIGRLAGGVAHDFNNLLTVIQANASLARIVKMTPEATMRAFNEIMEAATRAGTLTRQLLTFSRQQPVNKSSLNLNQVVSDMTRMLQRVIGETITMELRLSPESAPVLADASMMEQVVLNLVVNARDAMPGGGSLTLTTRLLQLRQLPHQAPATAQPGAYVCLEVRDTGTGIEAQHMARIFEPFFTTKEVGHGTGIGLATVFGILQQHDGWISVDSQPGAGAAFSVFIPVQTQPSLPPVEEKEESAKLTPEEAPVTGCILIVEDEATVRTIVKHVLTSKGYKVHEAVTGREALDLWPAIENEVDLLLTDMIMPGGVSGYQLADELMRLKPALKTIYTSGYSAESFRRDSVLSADAILLRKPYTASQLLEEVRRMLK